ncbi:MAG: c-type cytochrome [Betaproteobacteria bacterium]|nr:c-type cytochrome [Betaproteobacteria bacterium]
MSAAQFLGIASCVALLSSTGPASGADIVRGADVYRQYCASCHGASGNSTWPGAPNLSRREAPLRTDQALVQILRAGRGAKPGFQGMISDADLFNVIAYSRTLQR